MAQVPVCAEALRLIVAFASARFQQYVRRPTYSSRNNGAVGSQNVSDLRQCGCCSVQSGGGKPRYERLCVHTESRVNEFDRVEAHPGMVGVFRSWFYPAIVSATAAISETRQEANSQVGCWAIHRFANWRTRGARGGIGLAI